MSKRSSKADSHFEALFGARTGESITNSFKLIPAHLIERVAQARKSFPSTELDELAQSITDLRSRGEGVEGTGILQPLLVADNPSNAESPYRLIAGERRYRAAAIVGLESVPCLVVQMDEQSIVVAQLVENLQRQNLAPLEEAHAIEEMMALHKLSIRDTAKLLGKGKGYIENRLALLKMGEDVQNMVQTRPDTLLHAREIDGLTDLLLRQELIEAVLNDGLSRAMLRHRIGSQDTDSIATGGVDDRVGKQPTNSPDKLSVQTDRNGSKRGQTSALTGTALRPIISQLDGSIEDLEQKLRDSKLSQEQSNGIDISVNNIKSQIEALKTLLAQVGN